MLHRQPKHLLAFLLAELGTRWVLYVGDNKHDCSAQQIGFFPGLA
jgi:hypothetical protein